MIAEKTLISICVSRCRDAEIPPHVRVKKSRYRVVKEPDIFVSLLTVSA